MKRVPITIFNKIRSSVYHRKKNLRTHIHPLREFVEVEFQMLRNSKSRDLHQHQAQGMRQNPGRQQFLLMQYKVSLIRLRRVRAEEFIFGIRK
jgi:hypothetical protein